jgi:hypothetical protein
MSARAWQHLAVIAFLTVQLGAPLSYYLSDRGYDERFAWRMFSPTRMVRCQARVLAWEGADSEEIDLGRELAAPWVSWMERGHAHVVRGAGAFLCARRGPDARLTADLVCRTPDGEREVLLRQEPLCRE